MLVFIVCFSLQSELDAFQSQVQKDFDSLLEKVSQASQVILDFDFRSVQMLWSLGWAVTWLSCSLWQEYFPQLLSLQSQNIHKRSTTCANSIVHTFHTFTPFPAPQH